MNRRQTAIVLALTASAAAAITIAATVGDEHRNVSRKSSEASVVTNDNGSVSRTFVESTLATNGNMVTERRRETRTTLDTEGNLLESSTSEYAQSYSVDAGGMAPHPLTSGEAKRPLADAPTDTFLSLRFGDTYATNDLVATADEPTLLQAKFTPAKPLAGFDDYYVLVTPKTHRIAKVYACAREAVDPGARWRRHYLIEALERRYGTWARLTSFTRPCYAFDLGDGRYVTACLAAASRDYETVLAAWDDELLTIAANEAEELREAARQNAREARRRRVEDAAAAF